MSHKRGASEPATGLDAAAPGDGGGKIKSAAFMHGMKQSFMKKTLSSHIMGRQGGQSGSPREQKIRVRLVVRPAAEEPEKKPASPTDDGGP